MTCSLSESEIDAELEKQNETETLDSKHVIVNIDSVSDWNESAVEIITRIRSTEKLIVDARALIKQLYVTVASVMQSLDELERKKPTYEIVNNIEDEETESNDEEQRTNEF